MVEQKEIDDLILEIQEIRDSLPSHSVPASMLIRIEELEDQLEALNQARSGGTDAAA